MKLRLARMMLAAIVLAIAIPVGWAADPRPLIGQVDRIQGMASVAYDEATRPLKPADPIYLDDRLITGAAARLRVRLTDETEITLGENAELVVDHLSTSPTPAQARSPSTR